MRVDKLMSGVGVSLALVRMSRRLRGLEIATIILSKSRCGSNFFLVEISDIVSLRSVWMIRSIYV